VLTENITLTEKVSQLISILQSELLSVTDTKEKSLKRTTTVNNTVSLIQTIYTNIAYLQNNTLSLTDTLLLHPSILQDNTLTLQDLASAVGDWQEIITENLTVTESAFNNSSIHQNHSLVLNETMSNTLNILKNNVVSLTDSLIKHIDKTITNIISFVELAEGDKSSEHIESITETMSVQDQQICNPVVLQNHTVISSTVFYSSIEVLYNNLISFTDTVNEVRTRSALLTNTINLESTLEYVTTFSASIAEQVSLLDSLILDSSVTESELLDVVSSLSTLAHLADEYVREYVNERVPVEFSISRSKQSFNSERQDKTYNNEVQK
jgi:hypothetical protein